MKTFILTTLNFIFIKVHLSDFLIGYLNADLEINLAAGIAFVTILLFGLSGALGVCLALVAQYVQVGKADVLVIIPLTLLCVFLQYITIQICLKLLGVGTGLKGFTHAQLMSVSVVFIIMFACSNTFLLQRLRYDEVYPFQYQILSDFIGIVICLVILRSFVWLYRWFLSLRNNLGA